MSKYTSHLSTRQKIAFIIGKIIIPLFYKIIFKIKIYGKKQLPEEGPFIMASNHYSNWDPPLLGVVALPHFLFYMSKKELFKNKILGFIISSLGAFPVDRGMMKSSTLIEIEKIINKKGVLLMFPEGTRTRKNPNPKPKKGTAYIAIKYGLKVVPVHIKWPDTPFNTFIKFKRVKIYIKQPLSPPKDLTDKNIENFTNKIYKLIKTNE